MKNLVEIVCVKFAISLLNHLHLFNKKSFFNLNSNWFSQTGLEIELKGRLNLYYKVYRIILAKKHKDDMI